MGEPDALVPAWSAWTAALTAAGFDPGPVLNPPADPSDVDAATTRVGLALPAAVRALYAVCDGQVRDPSVVQLFPQYRFLPVADALTEWRLWREVADQEGPEGMADHAAQVTVRSGDAVRREYWIPGWWPLAVDGGGNMLAVDTDPPPGGTVGQIVVAGPDEDQRRVLASGIVAYLRALTAADLVVEDVGDGVLWWDVPTLR